MQSPSCPKTLLVVDDDDSVCRLLKDYLGQCGYAIESATSAPEALAVAAMRDWAISLLITDVNMPEMSGLELAKAFSDRRPEIPVLFISGDADSIDRAARTSLRCRTEILEKPLNFGRLLASIAGVIDRNPAL